MPTKCCNTIFCRRCGALVRPNSRSAIEIINVGAAGIWEKAALVSCTVSKNQNIPAHDTVLRCGCAFSAQALVWQVS